MKIQFDNLEEAITYADDAVCALRLISHAPKVRTNEYRIVVDDAVVEAGMELVVESLQQAISDIQERTTKNTLEAVS